MIQGSESSAVTEVTDATASTRTYAPGHDRVERVCAYSRQVCQLESGCLLPAELRERWDKKALNAAARTCSAAGITLKKPEADGAYIDTEHREKLAARKRKRRRENEDRG